MLFQQGDWRLKLVNFFPDLSEVTFDKSAKLLEVELNCLNSFQKVLDQELLVI